MLEYHRRFIIGYSLLALIAILFVITGNSRSTKIPYVYDYDVIFRWMSVVVFSVLILRLSDAVVRSCIRCASSSYSIVIPLVPVVFLSMLFWFGFDGIICAKVVYPLRLASDMVMGLYYYPRLLSGIFLGMLIWHSLCYYQMKKMRM